MFQPNTACAGFCLWMLTVSKQHLSGPQRALVTIIYNAAIGNYPVTSQQWYNFNLFAAWRNPYYLVYRDYGQVTAPGLLTNLISTYSLEGNSIDPASSNNGTDTAITYSLLNGKVLQGAGFNGSTSKIVIGAITPGAIFSLGFWVKAAPIGGGIEDIITPSASPVGLTLDKTSYKLKWFDGGFKTMSASINPSTWENIVITSDGTNFLFYFNGGLDSSYSFAVTAPSLDNIGGATNNSYYNGDLDIISFWQRCLTPTDVTAFYNSGAGIQYPF